MQTFKSLIGLLGKFVICIGAGFALAHSSQAADPSAPAAPRPVCNGKDLSGWRQPSGEWMAAGAVTPNAADPAQFNLK